MSSGSSIRLFSIKLTHNACLSMLWDWVAAESSANRNLSRNALVVTDSRDIGQTGICSSKNYIANDDWHHHRCLKGSVPDQRGLVEVDFQRRGLGAPRAASPPVSELLSSISAINDSRCPSTKVRSHISHCGRDRLPSKSRTLARPVRRFERGVGMDRQCPEPPESAQPRFLWDRTLHRPHGISLLTACFWRR